MKRIKNTTVEITQIKAFKININKSRVKEITTRPGELQITPNKIPSIYPFLYECLAYFTKKYLYSFLPRKIKKTLIALPMQPNSIIPQIVPFS